MFYTWRFFLSFGTPNGLVHCLQWVGSGAGRGLVRRGTCLLGQPSSFTAANTGSSHYSTHSTATNSVSFHSSTHSTAANSVLFAIPP